MSAMAQAVQSRILYISSNIISSNTYGSLSNSSHVVDAISARILSCSVLGAPKHTSSTLALLGIAAKVLSLSDVDVRTGFGNVVDGFLILSTIPGFNQVKCVRLGGCTVFRPSAASAGAFVFSGIASVLHKR